MPAEPQQIGERRVLRAADMVAGVDGTFERQNVEYRCIDHRTETL